MKAIKEILGDLAQREGWGQKLSQFSLWTKWKEIVGEEIGAHASPRAWRGKNLIVHVDNSVWLQELTFEENEIASKIRQTLPETQLERIYFKLGRTDTS